MPTVKLNKTVVEELVGKELPLEELKDRISMLGTDLEGIEGDEIQVEIFPDRPDMLSEQGFSRAFASFIGTKVGLREYGLKSSGLKVKVDPSVSMRPFTACAIVKNLNFNDERIREIMQAQEKLAMTHGRNRKKSAYGIYPLKPINFPISYIAKDPKEVEFQPLGFDKKMPATQVEELHPKGKEYKHVAEGWTKYPFFIDAKDNVMCMLPYTNSHDTGKVDESTTEVFIECTGNDLDNVKVALNIFTTMLADMGGDIYSLDIEYADKTITTPDLTPSEMDLDLEYTNKLLGLSLSKDQAVEYLKRMGFGFENDKVLVPAYRNDILHQEDLIEDIAIAYGYENFEEEIPNVATIGQEDPLLNFERVVRNLLVGHKLLEVKNVHLMTKEQLVEKMEGKDEPIPLQNALGEHNHLRSAVLPSLLKNLSENQHNEYPQNIFEVGKVFSRNKETETGIQEDHHLAVALCYEKADFTKIRQVLDSLMNSLGVEFTVKEKENDSFIGGRAAEIVVDGSVIGIIGELSPQVLVNWELQVPTVAFEINLEKVFGHNH